jgi:hypothetical protein
MVGLSVVEQPATKREGVDLLSNTPEWQKPYAALRNKRPGASNGTMEISRFCGFFIQNTDHPDVAIRYLQLRLKLYIRNIKKVTVLRAPNI